MVVVSLINKAEIILGPEASGSNRPLDLVFPENMLQMD